VKFRSSGKDYRSWPGLIAAEALFTAITKRFVAYMAFFSYTVVMAQKSCIANDNGPELSRDEKGKTDSFSDG
jgi:heme/copper-type cytochrome/quinol oxidase subunit 2